MEIRSVQVSGSKKQGHRKSSVWFFLGGGGWDAVSLEQAETLSPMAQPLLAGLSYRGARSRHHSSYPQLPLLPSDSCLDLPAFQWHSGGRPLALLDVQPVFSDLCAFVHAVPPS